MARGSKREGYGYFMVVLALHVLGGAAFVISGCQEPQMWGLGVLAYSFGLRHAFDADHIAAIDNTIRKLIAQKRNPLGVGLYFSLGHSTVVFLMVLALSLSIKTLMYDNPVLSATGGFIGTAVSALFLLGIGLLNTVVLIKSLRRLGKREKGQSHPPHEGRPHGFLTKLLAPAFRLVNRSWHVYPLGFLFGLGFDTATEIGILALSAGAAGNSFSWLGVMSLPLLFASGMSLMDTLDGAIMTRAYRWAFLSNRNRDVYNLTVTGVSVLSALFIGGVQVMHLFEGQLPSSVVRWMEGIDFVLLGYGLAGLLVLSWFISILIWKGRRYRHAVDRA
ncbi:High-affinity nickel-transport protein NixA [compost metagenome]